MSQQYAQGQNVHSQSWVKGLFDCFDPLGTCCLATWLPCLAYGRMASRMKDPNNPSPDVCNGDCFLFCCVSNFTCCGFLLISMKRGEIRQRHGIEGNGCLDCLTAHFCHCCALIQQDQEVRLRATMQPNVQGYVQNGGMAYAPK